MDEMNVIILRRCQLVRYVIYCDVFLTCGLLNSLHNYCWYNLKIEFRHNVRTGVCTDIK